MCPIVIIQRINALNNGISRVPDDERYDDIYWKLTGKRDELVTNLKIWICAKDRKLKHQRKQQVLLVCQLMKMDYHKILRDYLW